MKRTHGLKFLFLVTGIVGMTACGQGSNAPVTTPPATNNPVVSNINGSNLPPNTLNGVWKSAQIETTAIGTRYMTYQFVGNQLTIRKNCTSGTLSYYSQVIPSISFLSANSFQINGSYFFTTNDCLLTVDPGTVTLALTGNTLVLTKTSLTGVAKSENLVRVQ